jgi:hypothetical protein
VCVCVCVCVCVFIIIVERERKRGRGREIHLDVDCANRVVLVVPTQRPIHWHVVAIRTWARSCKWGESRDGCGGVGDSERQILSTDTFDDDGDSASRLVDSILDLDREMARD